MRLDALELVRYGHFDGRTLEFRKAGSAGRETDLQIVYGPNEAGKSTIREAISDLLFKVPLRSRMTFAVQDVLKVGARATVAQAAVEAYRLKRNKDDLVDAADRPLRDNPFAVVTDGFDRESFEQTFSVNRDQLESGGEMILKGEGDLGQLLFAGTSGLQGLPEKLADLDDRASAIWSRKSGASARVLADEIKAIDQRIRELQTTQGAYDTRRREVDRLAAAFGKARDELAAVDRDIRRVSGLLAALKPYRDRLRVLEDLEVLGEGETASEDDRERLTRIGNELAGLDARSTSAAEKMRAMEERRTAIPEADPILGFRDEIAALADMAANIRKERLDRPNREREAEDARDTIARVLRELEVEDTGDELALPTSTGRMLSALLKRRTELGASLKAAEQEAGNARETLDEAVRALDALPVAADPAGLRAVLKASRERDLTADQRDASRAIAGYREEIAVAMKPLGLSQDKADWLAGLTLPTADVVERLDGRLRKAAEEVARLEAQSAQLAAAVADAEDHLTSLGDAVVLSDDALVTAREQRDGVVTELRGDLAADAVEDLRSRLSVSISETDRIFEARIRNADRLGEMNAAVRSRERARLSTERISTELSAARNARADVEAEIAALVPQDVEVQGLAGVRVLITAQATVDTALARIATREAEQEAIATAAAGWSETLRSALAEAGRTVGEDVKLTVLQALAEECVADLEARGRERTAAAARKAEAEQSAARRAERIERLTAELADWQGEFAAALDGTWIPTDTVPDAVEAILARLPELTEARADLKTAQRRLDRMEEDAAATAAALDEFKASSGIGVPDDMAGADFVAVIDHLKRRLDAAQERDSQAAGLDREIASLAEEIEEIGWQAEQKRSEVADLAERFGASELADLSPLVRDGARRRDLQQSLADLDQAIRDALGTAALDDALALMDGADEEPLRSELDGLEADRDRLQEERDRSGQEHAVANAEFARMTGSDEIARLMQQRESLKVELIDQIQDYIRIRTGEKALSWALTRYRQANKAPMLEAAGRFFSRMTAGRYPELITQAGDKGDVLVAREGTGTLKTVDALSEGTRHQLFLSLRMAGYLELSRGRQAPPLILDDILSSSDDARTGAMLEALADLAEEVQVIVLTHHAHVLDIAGRAVDGRHSVVRLNGEG